MFPDSGSRDRPSATAFQARSPVHARPRDAAPRARHGTGEGEVHRGWNAGPRAGPGAAAPLFGSSSRGRGSRSGRKRKQPCITARHPAGGERRPRTGGGSYL